MAGFELLLSSVAGFLLTSRVASLKLGMSLALRIALGRFLASKVLIHSNYLPFVGALFGATVATATLLTLTLLKPPLRGVSRRAR